MTHRELMKLFRYAEEAVGTQVVTIEEPDGQYKITSMKDILEKMKPDTGVWMKTLGSAPRCPFCWAYSEDADRGTLFGDNDLRNKEPIHYCSNCGAYLV